MTSLRQAMAVAAAEEPAAAEEDLKLPDREQLVQHPDGWYWIAPDGRQEFGPFDTAEEALADMNAPVDDDAIEPGETLQEAEQELGLSDWVDPDTGGLAEGTSTHIEDH